MTNNVMYIQLKDERGSNNLDAIRVEDKVSIAVFDFECELSLESAKKLRDFLTHILENEDE